MVAGLAGIGLRVVLDVVYNHTVAAGDRTRSRCSTGSCPATTTGCRRPARWRTPPAAPTPRAEHAMMEKLIVDSVLHLGHGSTRWAGSGST